jgi:hypothetical protein
MLFEDASGAGKLKEISFFVCLRCYSWMRSSSLVIASGCRCQTRSSLGSIPASSDIVETEG